MSDAAGHEERYAGGLYPDVVASLSENCASEARDASHREQDRGWVPCSSAHASFRDTDGTLEGSCFRRPCSLMAARAPPPHTHAQIHRLVKKK